MYIKDWCEKVGNIISDLRFKSTDTINVVKTSDGYQLHVTDIVRNITTSQSGNSQPTYAILCIITGDFNQNTGYPVDLYENGYYSTSTGSGYVPVLMSYQTEPLEIGMRTFTWNTILVRSA